jgi:hypothetical protein
MARPLVISRNRTEQRGVHDADVDDVASGPTGEFSEPAQPTFRRVRIFLEPQNLPWLPVSEPAFLLWVLAALVMIWVGIAVALRLT